MMDKIITLYQPGKPIGKERRGQDSMAKLRRLTKQMEIDEKIILSSEKYLALAFQNLPCPVWIKDRDLRMVYINRAYSKIYDIPTERYVGKLDTDVWPPEIAEQFKQGDERVLNGEDICYAIERVPNRAGWRDYDHIKVIKFPLFEGDKIVGIAGVVTGVFA